jgi:hypothetical protein
VAIGAVVSGLLVREILEVVVAPHVFTRILPLAGVYVASVLGGERSGLLSIGLVLIGVDFVHPSANHFPKIPVTESILLQGLFVLLLLAVWYLASARAVPLKVPY